MSSVKVQSGERAAVDWQKIGILCVLGFSASLATWGVLQWKHPLFSVAEQYSIGMSASNEAREALLAQQARVNGLNAASVLAVAGGLLAGVLAIFAQPCCAAPMRVLIAIAGGAVWGAMSGWVGVRLFAAMMPSDSLPNPTNIGLAQAVSFALFGAGIGLLFGMFSRDKATLAAGLVRGAVAGQIGGLLFPIVSGLLISGQSTVDFLAANPMVQLLWLSLPMVAVAATVPISCRRQTVDHAEASPDKAGD